VSTLLHIHTQKKQKAEFKQRFNRIWEDEDDFALRITINAEQSTDTIVIFFDQTNAKGVVQMLEKAAAEIKQEAGVS